LENTTWQLDMIVIVTGQIPAIFSLQLSSAQQRGNFKLPAYTACEKSFEHILSCRNIRKIIWKYLKISEMVVKLIASHSVQRMTYDKQWRMHN
jgi:uncharacterized protein (UPF0262 family)